MATKGLQRFENTIKRIEQKEKLTNLGRRIRGTSDYFSQQEPTLSLPVVTQRKKKRITPTLISPITQNSTTIEDIFGPDTQEDQNDEDELLLRQINTLPKLGPSAAAKVARGTHVSYTDKNGKLRIKKIGIRQRTRMEKLKCGLFYEDPITKKLRKTKKSDLEKILKKVCEEKNIQQEYM